MFVTIYLKPVPAADQPAKNIVLAVPSSFNLQTDTPIVAAVCGSFSSDTPVQTSHRAFEGG